MIHVNHYKPLTIFVIFASITLFVLAIVYIMRKGKKKSSKKRHKKTHKKRHRKTHKKSQTKHVMKNLYGEPLERCQRYRHDSNGSWINGYCSETDGGVHQICMDVDQSSRNFAKDTNQPSNWSLNRVGKNHCMCLGAWSLYKERQKQGEIPETSDELHCDAISEISLSDQYTGKWNTWNGHEKPKQIVTGINSMVSQCYNNKRGKGRDYLRNNYCDFSKDKPEFHNTPTHKQLCL